MPATWLTVFLIAVAGAFGYHAWVGWKTGIARLPLSFFVIEEFERGESPHFWPITVLNALVSFAALVVAGFAGWSVFGVTSRSIDSLQSLNGCYEGEGLPDFMRPRDRRRAFRIVDGVIFDHQGRVISTIRVIVSTPTMTTIGFSPGVFVTSDAAKRIVIQRGATERAEAYIRGGRAYISLPDRLYPVHTTSCH